MQERLKSKVLWIAIAAVLMLLLRNYDLYHYIGMEESVFATLVDMILGILVLMGILNNPTDSENW